MISISDCTLDIALQDALGKPDCSVREIKTLLNRGANVNKKDQNRNTPLHIALLNNSENLSLIIELLHHGADVNLNNDNFDTALHIAIKKYSGNLDVIRELLKYKPYFSCCNHSKKTPLHIAVQKCDEELIKELLKCGSDVNCPNTLAETPLYFAVENRLADVVKILLKCGADPNKLDFLWISPLHVAVENSDLTVVRELLRHNADVNSKTRKCCMPLHIAVQNPQIDFDIIRELLRYGAFIHTNDLKSKNPLDYVLEKSSNSPYHLACVKMMVKYVLFRSCGKDFKQFINLDTYKESDSYNLLTCYMNCCILEIISMKKRKIDDRFSLYEYVRNHGMELDYLDPGIENMEDITRELILILLSDCYPIYEDILLDSVSRKYLVKNVRNLVIYTTKVHKYGCKVKRVALNSDSIHVVCTYLSNIDLLNLIQAFRQF